MESGPVPGVKRKRKAASAFNRTLKWPSSAETVTGCEQCGKVDENAARFTDW